MFSRHRVWVGLSLLAWAPLAAAQQIASVSVLTYHNDIARTGVNPDETILTPKNVNPASFGKVAAFPVDGDVYAQPLYLPKVAIPGQGIHNVLYVATEHDSVYAFDADGASTTPLWQVSFVQGAGVQPLSNGDVQCGDLVPEIGITGTPVIDAASGTLYVVAATIESGVIVDRLHALNVATGAEKFGGPVRIQASVSGSGDGSGTDTFNPAHAQQRPGLLLLQGEVYVAFASYCDHTPYHGWILGYDASTLALDNVLNVTPNAAEGGIWQGGVAPASDGASIYIATGNGGFDANSGGSDYGDTLLRLSPQLQVQDSFTPFDQQNDVTYDLDLAAAGPLIPPTQSGAHAHLIITSGKTGTIYVVDRDHMGGFHAGSDSQIVQSLPGIFHSVYGGFVFWNETLYGAGVYRWNNETDVPKALALDSQQQLSISSQATTPFAYPGGALAISANGSSNGILWAVQSDAYPNLQSAGGPAILHAYDATNLANQLYSSSQSGARDRMGLAIKFAVPTVANGRVYVGTRDEVDVFGLLTSGFSLSLTPASSAVAAGSPASLTLQSSPLGDFTSSLTLACAAPVSGCQITPTGIAASGTASVSIDAAALHSGSNTITISATGGQITRSASADITVTSPAPSALPLPAVSQITATSFTLTWSTSQALNTQAWYGTSQPANHVYAWPLATAHTITISGLQPGVTYQVQTESSYFTSPDLLSPIFPVTTAAAAPSVPSFTLALNPPDSTLPANTAANLTLATAAIDGDTSPLALSCTTPTSGCQLASATLTPGQSTTVSVDASALATGPNTVTVFATDGAISRSATANVTVSAPPSSGLSPPQVTQITNSGFTVSWTTAQALNSQVWYGASQPSTQLADWVLKTQHAMTVTGLQPATTYQVQVESSYFTNPDLTSAVFTVTTLANAGSPDFTLSLAPPPGPLDPGVSASLDLATASIAGDNSLLNLSCITPSTGCAINPNAVAPGQSATVNVAAASLLPGSNTVTVSATDGTNTHAASSAVSVVASPASLPVPQVSQVTSTSFTLTWTTAQALNSQVWYGASQPSAHAYSWFLVTAHTLTVGGLQPNTSYQVMAESSYFTNTDLTSPVFTVTTTP